MCAIQESVSGGHSLSTVDLDLVGRTNASLGKEGDEAVAVVALQLDDFPELGVFDHISVAIEILSKRAQDLIEIDVLRQAFARGQLLPSRALLSTNMNIARARAAAEPEHVTGLSKWIFGLQVQELFRFLLVILWDFHNLCHVIC